MLSEDSYFGDFQIFLDIRSNYRYISRPEYQELQVLSINREILESIMATNEAESNFLKLRA